MTKISNSNKTNQHSSDAFHFIIPVLRVHLIAPQLDLHYHYRAYRLLFEPFQFHLFLSQVFDPIPIFRKSGRL